MCTGLSQTYVSHDLTQACTRKLLLVQSIYYQYSNTHAPVYLNVTSFKPFLLGWLLVSAMCSGHFWLSRAVSFIDREAINWCNECTRDAD